jgi:hypothetical protein
LDLDCRNLQNSRWTNYVFAVCVLQGTQRITQNPGTGFVIITLPIPEFASVICFAVLRLAGDGIQLTPSLPFGLVHLVFLLLGELFIRDKLVHIINLLG